MSSGQKKNSNSPIYICCIKQKERWGAFENYLLSLGNIAEGTKKVWTKCLFLKDVSFRIKKHGKRKKIF